jgi:hypothetical protein
MINGLYSSPDARENVRKKRQNLGIFIAVEAVCLLAVACNRLILNI